MGYFSYGSAESSYSKQLATAYTVYMMFGSYFERCRMKNRVEETHLRMHYMSMKTNDQYKVEEKIDEQAEEMLRDLKVDDLACEVGAYYAKETYHVLFRTGILDFRVDIDQKGNATFHRVANTL